MDLRTATAYLTVWLVWGSTYLAIAIVVRAVPPLAAAGIRFLIAGLILIAWALWRERSTAPLRAMTAEDWRHAFVTGGLLLAIGNGVLSVVETRMPTGIAALIIASVPLWMTLIDSFERRTWPGGRAWLGLAAGAAGVVLLATEEAGWIGGAEPLYVVLMAGGALGWAIGSMYSRRSTVESMRLRVGAQMVCGSALLLVGSVVRQEPLAPWRDVPAAALWSLAYLVVFGAIASYTAYIWLLRNEPASSVGTYAFINPIVAVLLGAWLLAEPLTARTLAAGTLVVAAVVLVNRARPRAVARRV